MAGKTYSGEGLAGRRRRVLLDVRRGLSLPKIVSKHGVSKSTVTRDLRALRNRLGPDEARKLDSLIRANVAQTRLSSKENAWNFISLCQERIRGGNKLHPSQLMPRLYKLDSQRATKLINLFRGTKKNFSQIAKETGTPMKTVKLAYRRLVESGEEIHPRGRTAFFQKGYFAPEQVIGAVERTSKAAGLTVQEKAVLYCKQAGYSQRFMARTLGVTNDLIIKLMKSVREKIAIARAASPRKRTSAKA
ncbi:MAG: hypothetical protein JW744_05600 [Candidatus Diapherotrites archaeon]|uniref:Uncharacterized protein n=1 Tax=Candidatus Iainarchaeum sp. TaxID=3101447 RepID=A0A938YYB0_9ARCH|nr:hypothetical protein [Candidatus Diapherotrites archaeon]